MLKYWAFIIIAIILASISVYQISAQINVVINEVELNPFDDDYDAEWIELYNTSNNAVDVSGWSITATAGIPVQVVIDYGAIIPEKGYVIISTSGQWLDNFDETIVLRDVQGNIINTVGPFSDDDNDAKTWQRSPDGTYNWLFKTATPNTQNEQIAIEPEHPKPTVLTIATDKNSYAIGEKVGISGIVPKYHSSEKVSIYAIDPEGKAFKVVRVAVNENLMYHAEIDLTTASIAGNWILKSTYLNEIAQTTIQVLLPKSASTPPSSKLSTIPEDASQCKGTALCIAGKVKRIADGDTLVVDRYKIRLSLTNTPEKKEFGFKEAKAFTSKLCPVGSTAIVDQDDKQPTDKYKRIVGKVFCSGKILNAELLYSEHAKILTKYCSKSEFASEPWAKAFGC